jgi:hypothetical protein
MSSETTRPFSKEGGGNLSAPGSLNASLEEESGPRLRPQAEESGEGMVGMGAPRGHPEPLPLARHCSWGLF